MSDLGFPAIPGTATESRGPFGGIGSGIVSTELPDGTLVNVGEDGSVVITSAEPETPDYDDDDFNTNLAERLSDAALAAIAEEVIEGVEADKTSRADLIDQYEKGIELLGTRIEDISSPASTGRSVSRVGHPLLMESMVKYQAGAQAEMLPAEGPAKVAVAGSATAEDNQLAQDFQDDFNFYLTETATEYYPDTDQMLMHQAYCGNGYKKLFRCPMRDRPVSESVSMLDLIISEEATDLENAIRVTHQFQMTRAQLRRMQIAGRYRNIDLGMSQAQPQQVPGRAAVKQAEGLSPTGMRPQDVPYLMWETDVSLDIEVHGIDGKWERDAPEGLPLPYKVTVDPESRTVLGIWRNWKDGDRFYRKKNMYVRYGLVPGMGFHFWGFLQLLGNHTRALRAIWRLMIDAGMFSNFPGGVKLRGARTATNEIAPNPGEWVDVDAPNGSDIRQLLMALPYKAIDAVFIQLAQIIEEGAQRLGGSVTIETGEGRTNVPVGTVMSMIEQTTQVMAAVHKRNHRAQREELCKFRELFVENPNDLWKFSPDPKRQWEVAQEFTDLKLTPASDPNIPAQVHRIMQAWALMTIAAQNPQMYDIRQVHERVLRTIRIADPETLLVTPEQASQPQPDPKMAQIMSREKIEQQRGQQRMAEVQIKAQADAANDARDAQQAALESADKAADRQSRERVALMKEETERLKLEREQVMHPEMAGIGQPVGQPISRPMTPFDSVV